MDVTTRSTSPSTPVTVSPVGPPTIGAVGPPITGPAVIACDVDGTLFDGRDVAPAACHALDAARRRGHTLVINSGRRADALADILPMPLDWFAVLVCEDGGVLADPATGARELLAAPTDPRVVQALRDAGVPDLDVGQVTIGAPVSWAAVLREVCDGIGGDRRLVVNKGSVALVPNGCDKGSGLRVALGRLELGSLPLIALGDAENDLPMFAVATHPVAVGNADAAVRAAGVPRTRSPLGDGVAEALLALGVA